MRFLIFALCCWPVAAQVCSTPSFPTAVTTQQKLLVAVDNAQTKLTQVQLFSDTTAHVLSSTGWIPNMMATIGIEQELVTGITGNVLTVVRGQAGTTAIQHPAQSVVSNFIDACYNNIKTAEILAIETALGPSMTNILGALPFVTNAVTPSGQVITPGTHGQGVNAAGSCFAGPVVVDHGHNVASGAKVECSVVPDGHGNLTFKWITGDVQSLMVQASGRGPIGYQGASGIGAEPYRVNATTTGQTIAVGTHGQGANPFVSCWSGPLINGNISGSWVSSCVPANDGAGNLTITWTTSIGSIWVGTSGSPAPFTINTTGSPMTILQTTHQKGISPESDCYTGALSGSGVTGFKGSCEFDNDGSGNLILKYAGTEIGSVRIQ